MTHAKALVLTLGGTVVVHRHTQLERRGPHVALVLQPFGRAAHAVDLITYQLDGSVVLNSGGHTTPLAKARINAFLPEGLGWSVWSRTAGLDRRAWYLVGAGRAPVRFQDGMSIRPDGTLVPPVDPIGA